MTYNELRESKNLDDINYFDLLQCDEWLVRRAEILHRDNFECIKCGSSRTQYTKTLDHQKYYYHEIKGEAIQSNGFVSLQIHHILYIYNKLPWSYHDKYLVTLCSICHHKFHNDNSVEVWDEHQLNKMEVGSCDRCSGKGYIKEYRKIQNGICFKCRGFGYNRRLINLTEI
jgi:hypothetical protein